MRHRFLSASLASLALAAFVPAQGAMLPAPDTFPQPAEGHGAPGRLVEGAEQWLVEFRTRSFDLTALRAARERGASAADVAAIVRSYEQSATRDRAAFTAAVEKLGRTVGQDIQVFTKEAVPLMHMFRPAILTVDEDVNRAGHFLARAAIHAIREPLAPPMQGLEVPVAKADAAR